MLSVFYCYPLLTEILYPLLNRVTHTRPGLDTLSAVGKNLSIICLSLEIEEG